MLFFYAAHLFDILYFLQIVTDGFHIIHVMYPSLNFSFKDTIFGFDG